MAFTHETTDPAMVSYLAFLAAEPVQAVNAGLQRTIFHATAVSPAFLAWKRPWAD